LLQETSTGCKAALFSQQANLSQVILKFVRKKFSYSTVMNLIQVTKDNLKKNQGYVKLQWRVSVTP